MTQLTNKLVKNMGDAEYRQCLSLNLRDRGTMGDTLRAIRRLDTYMGRPRYQWNTARVFMIKDDDGTLLAWALIFQHSYGRRFECHTYTRRTERRKGHGTRLLKAVRRSLGQGRWNQMAVAKYNDRSIGFYESLGKVA
jgi:GNAT superfamily N-acetyltransferase